MDVNFVLVFHSLFIIVVSLILLPFSSLRAVLAKFLRCEVHARDAQNSTALFDAARRGHVACAEVSSFVFGANTVAASCAATFEMLTLSARFPEE